MEKARSDRKSDSVNKNRRPEQDSVLPSFRQTGSLSALAPSTTLSPANGELCALAGLACVGIRQLAASWSTGFPIGPILSSFVSA